MRAQITVVAAGASLVALVLFTWFTGADARTLEDRSTPHVDAVSAADQRRTLQVALPVLTDRSVTVEDAGILAEAQRATRTAATDLSAAEIKLVRRDGEHTMHLVAADDAICWVRREAVGGGGTSCAVTHGEIATLASGQLALAVDWTDDGFRVSGLVPSGTSDVQLTLRDGSRQALAVTGNTISVEVKTVPREVTWLTSDARPQQYEFADILE